MPKTVKKKKAKAAKSSAVAVAAPDEAVAAFVPIVIPPTIVKWATLKVQLVNWEFAEFTMRVKVTAPVFCIKNALEDRHGKMEDLKLYIHHVADENLLQDEFQTLADLGIEGAETGADPVECNIYYDFKPHNHDDPLLLTAGV